MRSKVSIIAAVGVIICLAIWHVVETVVASSRTKTFAEYYEPCEPGISLNFTDYTLPLDINDIVNFDTFDKYIKMEYFSDLICRNGFAVVEMEPNFVRFYSLPYDSFSDVDFIYIYDYFHLTGNVPAFITTDVGFYLYLSVSYHVFKDIEERLFTPGSSNLTNALLNDALKKYGQLGTDPNFEYYQKRFKELTAESSLSNRNEWNQNLYWSWLYCLDGLLQELPEGYPNFIRTQAWHRKNLNTALASCIELRHDPVIQIKQGDAHPPVFHLPVPPPGYIEPNPVFWGRLLSQVRILSRNLDALDVLTNESHISVLRNESRKRLGSLEKLLEGFIEIVNKQLSNEELSPKERKFFESVPYELLLIYMNLKGQCIKTSGIADIYTNTQQKLLVEGAVGNIDLLIVACPTSDGKAFLAAGPIFSYYEFKHPMADRLTDEAWFDILFSENRPERPKWYMPLMVQKNNTEVQQ